jgi:hypothetical protein
VMEAALAWVRASGYGGAQAIRPATA